MSPVEASASRSGDLLVRFLGHSTVLLELDGIRVLTDPVLRNVGPLFRHGPPPTGAHEGQVDVVLISHGHRDHLDIPSLRRLAGDPLVIVPGGLETLVRRGGLRNVRGARAGDELDLGRGVRSLTVPALHDGARPPMGPTTSAIGFLVGGSSFVYFAGDTDLFPEMAHLRSSIDVALLPVWGWGPYLGPGHLNPRTAAEAAALVGARVSIPIHWGTLFPRGLHRVFPNRLTAPPVDFAHNVELAGVRTEVRILRPGEETVVMPLAARHRDGDCAGG